MEPSEKFYLNQEAELGDFEDSRVGRFIHLLDQARRNLDAELRSYNAPGDKRRIQYLIDQIDQVEKDMKTHLKEVIDPTTPIAKLVAKHQSEALSAITGKTISVGFDSIPTQLLAKVAEYNFEKVTSIAASQFSDLRAVVFTRIGIKGENPRKVAMDLTGPEGQFAKPFHIVENVLRTESSTLYNTMRMDNLTSMDASLDLGLKKRVVERMDPKRNHPISRVLNDRVQNLKDPFKAKVSDVLAAVKDLRYPNGKPRRISQYSLDHSIFWPKIGGYYVGENLPAHYRERGIVVPTDRPVTTT